MNFNYIFINCMIVNLHLKENIRDFMLKIKIFRRFTYRTGSFYKILREEDVIKFAQVVEILTCSFR